MNFMAYNLVEINLRMVSPTLQFFDAIIKPLAPKDSLLREFIGSDKQN